MSVAHLRWGTERPIRCRRCQGATGKDVDGAWRRCPRCVDHPGSDPNQTPRPVLRITGWCSCQGRGFCGREGCNHGTLYLRIEAPSAPVPAPIPLQLVAPGHLRIVVGPAEVDLVARCSYTYVGAERRVTARIEGNVASAAWDPGDGPAGVHHAIVAAVRRAGGR